MKTLEDLHEAATDLVREISLVRALSPLNLVEAHAAANRTAQQLTLAIRKRAGSKPEPHPDKYLHAYRFDATGKLIPVK